MDNLGLITFYFLLRVGEYTTTKSKNRRWTKQFRAKDISFQKDGVILKPKGDLDTLLTASG